mmetsp:Transcript_12962/g.19675  ORF Transcript_12962/g.19675 Transcript_12962/m.19675 type:complete len:83 (-) Transcript_12962:93-341(-)
MQKNANFLPHTSCVAYPSRLLATWARFLEKKGVGLVCKKWQQRVFLEGENVLRRVLCDGTHCRNFGKEPPRRMQNTAVAIVS